MIIWLSVSAARAWISFTWLWRQSISCWMPTHTREKNNKDWFPEKSIVNEHLKDNPHFMVWWQVNSSQGENWGLNSKRLSLASRCTHMTLHYLRLQRIHKPQLNQLMRPPISPCTQNIWNEITSLQLLQPFYTILNDIVWYYKTTSQTINFHVYPLGFRYNLQDSKRGNL